MTAQRGCRRFNLAFAQCRGDVLSNFCARFYQGSGFDCPTVEDEGRFGADEPGRLHLFGPQSITRRDDELCLWELRLQELAKFVSMPGVNRQARARAVFDLADR